MQITLTQLDWQAWLQRWDDQQMGYPPDREERFTVMLDVLAALLPPNFVALDLACGPGAISQRLLARFPHAHALAVDIDPVLLAIGQGALGTQGGRLRWVEADLRDADWPAALGSELFDAVLSTTALHWLTADELPQVYAQLAQRMRPGGVFLNGDHLPYGLQRPSFRRLAERAAAQQQAQAFGPGGVEDWARWWDAVAAEPAFAALLAERQRRFPVVRSDAESPDFDRHVAALHAAGFREIDVIWQRLDNRILMAVR